ncbi:branched-chain amino acid ABC transporter permease [Allorhizobium borbori]|uniref:Branched-chain amino acid transport system permease protein n=1 Tax=Allorhizobium borbori TaxID=485907 RepID=A0A7W6K4I6_9HYPH|nr:branched-chain amino acid ABC transporter permease [Allorhizobium borbori]MBB4104982.1 branched-chain amino acid transport system permease protein [Allorhizobium borbori]
MSMMLLAQACATGITNGLIYALVGLGMAVIFKGSRLINAMHGELAVVGAATAVYCVEIAMWPTWLAVTMGMLIAMVLSTLVDIGLVRRLFNRNAREESFLLLTVGLGFTFSAAVLYVFGREEHLLPAFGDEIYEVAGAIIREQTIWIVGIAAFILIGLKLFYKYTDFGLAMMAASIDPDGAATTGINVRLMRTATFALGGLMAAVAGLLVTPMIGVSYQMGPILTLKGFAAAVLGGLTNPLGALVGGITIGLLESLSIVYISSGLKDAVALSVLIVIMILVPDGILGRSGRKGG